MILKSFAMSAFLNEMWC